MKLHCIIIPFNSSAEIALASGSKNTSIAARTHSHRSDVEGMSDLSGSNLMIRKDQVTKEEMKRLVMHCQLLL